MPRRLDVAFSETFPVKEQLRLRLVGIDRYPYRFALPPRKVPVRQEMRRRGFAPERLVLIERVFGLQIQIHRAADRADARPHRLAAVLERVPEESAHHPWVGKNPLPCVLAAHESAVDIVVVGADVTVERVVIIVPPPRCSRCAALRREERLVRMRRADAVDVLPEVICPDDVQLVINPAALVGHGGENLAGGVKLPHEGTQGAADAHAARVGMERLFVSD